MAILRDELRHVTTRQELGKILARSARETFDYHAFVFSFYDQDKRLLDPVYAEDTALGAAQPTPVSVNLFIGRVLSGKPVLVNRHEPPTETPFDRFGEENRLSRSLMFCPVYWNQRIIGMISVQSYDPNRYDDESLEKLKTFAEEAFEATGRLYAHDRYMKLLSALDQTSSMVMITDRSGIIEYVNQGLLQATGYAAEEILGSTPNILKSGRHDPDVYQEMWDTIFKGGEWQGELWNRRKNGTVYWVSVRVSPIRDTSGEITHFLSVQEDITHRRLMEARLSHSERTGRALIDSFPMYASLIDPDGMVLDLNERLAERWGQRREDIIGAPAYDFMPETVVIERRRHVAEVVATGEPVRFEDAHSGREYTTLLTPIKSPAGRVIQIGVFADDVTELRRNERLAALGMTASSLAHYIRNIQTTLNGSTRLLDTGIQNNDDSLIAQAWPMLKRANHRLNRLVNNMLALARKNPSREPVDASEAMKEAVQECRETAAEANVLIHENYSPDLPMVMADPTRLHDAFLNLIMNATEAIHDAGIRDGVISIRIASGTANNEVLVEVCDNGPGFDAETRRLLMEPFFTTKGSHGTGIGLAVVKAVVAECEGTLSVEGSLRKGACFTLNLPGVRVPELTNTEDFV